MGAMLCALCVGLSRAARLLPAPLAFALGYVFGCLHRRVRAWFMSDLRRRNKPNRDHVRAHRLVSSEQGQLTIASESRGTWRVSPDPGRNHTGS